MSQNNKKRIYGIFTIIVVLFLYQLLEYQTNPISLESYCQYGYISKEKSKQNQIQIDCIACYSFDSFSDQTGYVQLIFFNQQPPNKFSGLQTQKKQLQQNQNDKLNLKQSAKDNSNPKQIPFIIEQTQDIIIYQNDCTQFQCSDLLNSDDIKFTSNSQLIKLETLGFKQRQKQNYNQVSSEYQNRIRVPFKQSYQRHGFLVKVAKDQTIKSTDSLAEKDSRNPKGAQIQQYQELPLIKPIFKLYHLENSLSQRLLMSAVGLIAFNQISILLLLNFLEWRIAYILAAWTTYIMLRHEASQNFSRVYIILSALINYLSPSFNISYSIINIVTVFSVCLGSHFKHKKSAIYINFFCILSLLSYLANLEWLILSIPQLLYFTYSLGPLLPNDQKALAHRPPRKTSYGEHVLIEDDDVQIKVNDNFIHENSCRVITLQ